MNSSKFVFAELPPNDEMGKMARVLAKNKKAWSSIRASGWERSKERVSTGIQAASKPVSRARRLDPSMSGGQSLIDL